MRKILALTPDHDNRRSAAAPGGLTILDWTCIVVVVGCIETIGVRLRRIMQALEAQKGYAR